MRKAHLFEALYLVNQSIDDAVRGLQRLKKAPELYEHTFAEGEVELELRRSKVNVQFLSDLSKREKGDVARFKEELGSYTDEPLDHNKICELMRLVEEERKEEGLPPMVQFLDAAPPEDTEEPPPAG